MTELKNSTLSPKAYKRPSLSCPPPPQIPEVDWIQCDVPDCKKWRKLPLFFEINKLPDPFFCRHLKEYPNCSKQNSCKLPEMKAGKKEVYNLDDYVEHISLEDLNVGEYLDVFCRLKGVGWTEAQVLAVEPMVALPSSMNCNEDLAVKDPALENKTNIHSKVKVLVRYAQRPVGKMQPDDEWLDRNTLEIDLRLAPHGTMVMSTRGQVKKFNEKDPKLVNLLLQDMLCGIVDHIEENQRKIEKEFKIAERKRLASEKKRLNAERKAQANAAKLIKLHKHEQKSLGFMKTKKAKKVGMPRKLTKDQLALIQGIFIKGKSKVVKTRPAFRFFCHEKRRDPDFNKRNMGLRDAERKKALRAMWREMDEEDITRYKNLAELDKIRFQRETVCEDCIRDLIARVVEPDLEKHGELAEAEKKLLLKELHMTVKQEKSSYKRTKSQNGGPAKPKRPLTPFMVFYKVHRQQVIDHESAKGRTLSLAGARRRLHFLWGRLSQPQQAPYTLLSLRLVDKYKTECHVYELEMELCTGKRTMQQSILALNDQLEAAKIKLNEYENLEDSSQAISGMNIQQDTLLESRLSEKQILSLQTMKLQTQIEKEQEQMNSWIELRKNEISRAKMFAKQKLMASQGLGDYHGTKSKGQETGIEGRISGVEIEGTVTTKMHGDDGVKNKEGLALHTGSLNDPSSKNCASSPSSASSNANSLMQKTTATDIFNPENFPRLDLEPPPQSKQLLSRKRQRSRRTTCKSGGLSADNDSGDNGSESDDSESESTSDNSEEEDSESSDESDDSGSDNDSERSSEDSSESNDSGDGTEEDDDSSSIESSGDESSDSSYDDSPKSWKRRKKAYDTIDESRLFTLAPPSRCTNGYSHRIRK